MTQATSAKWEGAEAEANAEANAGAVKLRDTSTEEYE